MAFKCKRVNTKQVQIVLESLNSNKGAGYDSIPGKALKIGTKALAPPLTTLFNSYIKNNKWPSDWKRGEWTPVFKRDYPLAKENYRPITVLPCVNKVFEQLISRQITTVFDIHLRDCLSAYRKHHSCETTLIALVEDWKVAIVYQLVSYQQICPKLLTVSIHHSC